MGLKEDALALHAKARGKLEVKSKVPLQTRQDLTLAYTPGVAAPCLEIQRDANLAYKYTSKWNMVAVVTDGTAVLGLGDIGSLAGLPVMEGKALLFKEFAGVDAFPICVDSKNPDEIVKTVKLIAPTFGGINLEDISAPRCFEIEERLKRELDIPVFHDDQHGTAIVVAAATTNAFALAGKKFEESTFVINGAGAAGTALAKILVSLGAKNVISCDSKGVIFDGRTDLNEAKQKLAKITNKNKLQGTLADAARGADVLIGVSVKGAFSKEMIKSMAEKPIVFAMANPDPEILPSEAKEAGAFIVATGRSDYPNQVNNVLGFPGIFRGALDVRASAISEGMKHAAARALASLVPKDKLSTDFILPNPLDRTVAPAIAKAVAEQAKKEGLTREFPA
ncbi:MAG: malic enzyme-like NAD(P)-binding protein [Candidatus Micrarchaeia archaeon]|jgi:malate dehydrogenase (oxaloacetate-decarboxylating)